MYRQIEMNISSPDMVTTCVKIKEVSSCLNAIVCVAIMRVLGGEVMHKINTMHRITNRMTCGVACDLNRVQPVYSIYMRWYLRLFAVSRVITSPDMKSA